MSCDPELEERADALLEAIEASSKKQRRLYSKTFWDLFHYKKRTKARVEAIKCALEKRNILLTMEAELGEERKTDWLTLSLISVRPPDPTPEPVVDIPSDAWFEKMATRSYESESEVVFYFVIQLLEALGYDEDDFAIGGKVVMFQGVNKANKRADLIVYDGKSRDKKHALLVVETKNVSKKIDEIAVGQAKSYAIWSSSPYYLVTNGEEIRIFLNRGGGVPDVLLETIDRSELRTHWLKMHERLSRQAIRDYKRKLLDNFSGASGSLAG